MKLNDKLIAFLLVLSILSSGIILTLPFNTLVNASVEDGEENLFSNPVTFESDFKIFLQKNLDQMNEIVEFTVTNNEIIDRILVIDEDNKTIDFTSYLGENLINTTLYDMKPDNYNAYTRLAYGGILKPLEYQAQLTTKGNDKNLKITIDFGYLDSPNQLKARREVANHAKVFLDSAEYKSLKTDHKKLNAINKFITETFQYDYRLFVDGESSVIYSAYQMIKDAPTQDGHPIGGYPRGVCQAYTLYGYIMLKLAGFEAITIDGTTGDGNEFGVSDHSWNMVKVGKYWYHIDFTWNDPISSNVLEPNEYIEYKKRQDGAGISSTDYFLLTDEEISKTHKWEQISSGFAYPKAKTKWTGVTIPEDKASPTPVPTAIVPTATLTPTPTLASTPTKALTPTSMPTATIEPTLQPSNESIIPTAGRPDYLIKSKELPEFVIITGFLKDKNNDPLEGIVLELFSSKNKSTTNEEGYYRFDKVQVGNYKLYAKDSSGDEIANMDVVISFGEITEHSSGEVKVSGGRLQMDLILDNNNLSVKSVELKSDRDYLFEVVIILIIIIVGLAVIYLVLTHRKKNDYQNSVTYLE